MIMFHIVSCDLSIIKGKVVDHTIKEVEYAMFIIINNTRAITNHC